MKNITTVAAGALVAVALSGALAGCSPTTEKPYTGSAPATPTVWTGSPAPAEAGEHGGVHERAAVGTTLHQYIVDNNIAEVPFKKGDPGAPAITFPLPAGWTPAGDQTPEWAYGAIVYGTADPSGPPKSRADSTFMYAIGCKLTGNIDAEKVLALAPGQLDELPGFTPLGKPERVKFGGFDSVDYVGTFPLEGKVRAVGQQTVVIPAKDGLYVIQLNGETSKGQEQVVVDAANVIRDQTKITLPS